MAKIVGARDVDPKPEGSGEEHREDVPKTYDGKQGTTWTTMSYSKANFGGEKPGVGIVYDLGSVVSILKGHGVSGPRAVRARARTER